MILETPSQPAAQDVNEAYDSPGWWYNLRGFCILKLSYRDSLTSQIRFFARTIAEKHLEVAVGTGTLLKMILAWRRIRRLPPSKIDAVDYAEAMLASARRCFADHEHVSLQRADAGRLGYPEGSFRSVNVANAFHCFSEPD